MSYKQQRIKTLIESVLTEYYTPDDIHNILWNSFKTKVDAIELVDETDQRYLFAVTPRVDPDDSLTIDDANEILGELHDTGFFDIEWDANNKKLMIAYHPQGVPDGVEEGMGLTKSAPQYGRTRFGKPGQKQDYPDEITVDQGVENKKRKRTYLKVKDLEDYGYEEPPQNLANEVPPYQQTAYSGYPQGATRLVHEMLQSIKNEVKRRAKVVEDRRPADMGVRPADRGVRPADMGTRPEDQGVQPADMGRHIVDEQQQGDHLEQLAELEHEQWIEWAQSMMDSEEISQERKRRWEQYMVPYDELDEDAKEQDRKWARKVLSIVNQQGLDETIKKVGDKWVVYPEGGGERLGTHDTKAAAQKQLAAIEANKR